MSPWTLVLAPMSARGSEVTCAGPVTNNNNRPVIADPALCATTSGPIGLVSSRRDAHGQVAPAESFAAQLGPDRVHALAIRFSLNRVRQLIFYLTGICDGHAS